MPMPYTPSNAPLPHKTAASQRIASDIARFRAAGGRITHLPNGEQHEPAWGRRKSRAREPHDKPEPKRRGTGQKETETSK